MDTAASRILEAAGPLSDAVGSLGQAASAYNAKHAGKGLGLLDAKTHALLRYTAALARYGAARIRGEDVEAIQKYLVEGWAVLERVRPLEKAARPAIEALLKRAVRDESAGAVVTDMNGGGEAIRPRPDPANMLLDGEDDSESDGGAAAQDSNARTAGGDEGDGTEKKYQPPRIAEVVYDGEREAMEERETRTRAKMAARVARSRAVKEMMAEVSGAPEEIHDEDDMDEGDAAGKAMASLRRQEEERSRYEEENFTRLNVTREDKKRRKALERAAERGGHGDGGGIDGDPFADLMGVAERVVGKSKAKVKKTGQERADALEAMDRGLTSGKKSKKKSDRRKGGKRRR